MAPEAGKVIDFKGFVGGKNLFTMPKNSGERRWNTEFIYYTKKILNSRTLSAYSQQRKHHVNFITEM
jgi:hypothetical protein